MAWKKERQPNISRCNVSAHWTRSAPCTLYLIPVRQPKWEGKKPHVKTVTVSIAMALVTNDARIALFMVLLSTIRNSGAFSWQWVFRKRLFLVNKHTPVFSSVNRARARVIAIKPSENIKHTNQNLTTKRNTQQQQQYTPNQNNNRKALEEKQQRKKSMLFCD